jgi:hypothetical protein
MKALWTIIGGLCLLGVALLFALMPVGSPAGTTADCGSFLVGGSNAYGDETHNAGCDGPRNSRGLVAGVVAIAGIGLLGGGMAMRKAGENGGGSA